MSVYYSSITGHLYTERFPAWIGELAPIVSEDGVVDYEVREYREGEPGFEDALERWLFIHKGVRKYPKKPKWAVE